MPIAIENTVPRIRPYFFFLKTMRNTTHARAAAVVGKIPYGFAVTPKKYIVGAERKISAAIIPTALPNRVLPIKNNNAAPIPLKNTLTKTIAIWMSETKKCITFPNAIYIGYPGGDGVCWESEKRTSAMLQSGPSQ